ncbi:MAG: hypothetical protein WCN81_16730, partial [Actinomycetes bacterium]
ITLTDDEASLSGLHVELAWIHHQVLPAQLLSGTRATRPTFVFGHMSPFEPLELPFLADTEARLADVVVANSEETADMLRLFGPTDLPVVVLGNPAPDSFWAASGSRPEALRRLLFVTNHMPDELRIAMSGLKTKGLDVEHIGWSGRIALVTPEEIAAADAVVTIGKTAQYALAVGRPVFCYDVHGGPGWLSPENLSLARIHNFSGRPYGRMSAEDIVGAILDGYQQADADVGPVREAVSDLTWSHGLDSVFASMPRSRRDRRPLTDAEKRRAKAYFLVAGRAALAHHALAQSDVTSRALSEALDGTQASLSAAEARADALVNRAEILSTSRAAAEARADVLASQARILWRQLALQEEQLRGVVGSKSWRVTAPLRGSAGAVRRLRTPRRSSDRRHPRQRLSPEVSRVASLPALAWLCRVSADSCSFIVGPDVEVCSDGICEGAWVGPFRGDRLTDCLTDGRALFGSAAVFEQDGVVFVPPSHPREALYLLQDLRSGRSYVSNSMCFALAQVREPDFASCCQSLSASVR